MRKSLLAILILVIPLNDRLHGDDVIFMPLPQTERIRTDVDDLAKRMVLAITGSSQGKRSMFDQGLDSLNRYAARRGRTRNHYNADGFITRSDFLQGPVRPFFSSYEGPRGWGWGWYGSPIIINNYCPNMQGRCLPSSTLRFSYIGI